MQEMLFCEIVSVGAIQGIMFSDTLEVFNEILRPGRFKVQLVADFCTNSIQSRLPSLPTVQCCFET